MDWTSIFFQGWHGIVRTLIVAPLAYATLVVFLRVSGKRTLSKLNAFDLVVTIALGSTLSAVLLQKSVALAEGASVLALLIGLQFVISFASTRSRQIARLVRSEPTLLARNGTFCDAALRRERLTREEVIAAVRQAGGRDIEAVDYAFLESDGSLTVGLRGRE